MAELGSEELSVQPPGGRVLYTCVDASASYIAFGANTGSIYVHAATNLKLLVLVPLSQGSVNRIALSQSGEYLAAACGRNIVLIKHNAGTRDTYEVTLNISQHDSNITALTWDSTTGRVFAGYEDGYVSIAKLPLVISHNLCEAGINFFLYREFLSSKMSHPSELIPP